MQLVVLLDPLRAGVVAVVAEYHFERFDPRVDHAVGVLDLLAQLADQRLGLIEVGTQLLEALVALLELVLELGDAVSG